MVIFYTFLGLVLLRVVVITVLLLLLLTVGPACPACGRDTIRIHNAGVVRLFPWIERRFCLHCGWGGLTRRRRTAAVTVPESVAAR